MTQHQIIPATPNATAELLAWSITETSREIDHLRKQITDIEGELAGKKHKLTAAEEHLGRLRILADIVAGRIPAPDPATVEQYPNGSVRIGVLVFQHPGPDASEAQLRGFAESMRAIYDVATPAATDAVRAANALRDAEFGPRTGYDGPPPAQDPRVGVSRLLGCQVRVVTEEEEVVGRLEDVEIRDDEMAFVVMTRSDGSSWWAAMSAVLSIDPVEAEPAEPSGQAPAGPATDTTDGA